MFKIQDLHTKIHLHFYAQAMSDLKMKLEKQFHLHTSKKSKLLTKEA